LLTIDDYKLQHILEDHSHSPRASSIMVVARRLFVAVASALLSASSHAFVAVPQCSRRVLNLHHATVVSEENVESVENVEQPIRRHRNNKKEPIIAIVGRPNVGKSALVNRIAGTNTGGAIVADESGITRDRTYRVAEFLGERFKLVDTGGLVFDDQTLFAEEIRQQAMIAMEEAAAVIFITDGSGNCHVFAKRNTIASSSLGSSEQV
jgi:tRNA U34 5-carboxymethylaminomethyl modifying GTPase MnmE/TrmE